MFKFIFLAGTCFILGATSCVGTPLEGSHDDTAVSTKVSDTHSGENHHHKDEPRPFDAKADAWADLDRTMDLAKSSGKRTIVVMGANWCHDSRGLAAYFEDVEFRAEHITPYFEQVYIDVGEKSRNLDLARHFGLDGIEGTPTIFIVSPEGQVLNFETAPTWRNAASRSKEDIVDYFKDYRTPQN